MPECQYRSAATFFDRLEQNADIWADFLLANRRAARLEEIELHGKPVSFRKVLQQSKKVYSRKRLKKEIPSD